MSTAGSKRLGKYCYAGDGRLYEAKDLALNRTHTYTRDDLGRPIYSRVTEGDTTLLYTGRTYDTANRQTGYAYGGAGLPDRTVRYSYFDANGLLAMTTLADGNHTYYYYDALERLTATGTTNTFGREYTYAAPGGTNVGNTTPLVSKLNYSRSGAQLMSFNYTYVYDGLGQLTTVKDKSGAVLYSYTYDGAGNILTATENGATVSYTYGDSGWQDLLTAYNGQEITYDAIGNPTSYRGWTLGWQNGRQLATAAKSGKSVSYAYDVNGIRASKTVDGVKHTYVYDGTQLLAERYGTTRLEFMYNESGQPHLVRYSTNSGSSYVTYYYILNQQGDVMALMDTAGELAVKYTYDPWGRVLTVTNGSGTAITSATHIANVNPIRYRSYYYDTDTQLYYLQSRYYDPEVSRFLNADEVDQLGAEDGLVGYNLFAYCINDPINRVDVDGNLSLPNWAKVAIGTVALAGAVALTVATGGGAAAVAVGVAKVVGSVALSTAVSAGTGYLKNGKQGAIDGACNGFMFGSLSALGGAAFKYAKVRSATTGSPNSMGQAGERMAGIDLQNNQYKLMAELGFPMR